MRLRGAILVTTLFATPIAAMAQPITGLYVGGGVGLHAPQDPKATTFGPGFGAGTIKLQENFGFNSNLAVGYGIGNGFRLAYRLRPDVIDSGFRLVCRVRGVLVVDTRFRCDGLLFMNGHALASCDASLSVGVSSNFSNSAR